MKLFPVFVTCCGNWISLPRSHEHGGWFGKVSPSPPENDVNLPDTLIDKITRGIKEHLWLWCKNKTKKQLTYTTITTNIQVQVPTCFEKAGLWGHFEIIKGK